MIHYHGLPMWPSNAMLRAMKSHHACVSYANPEQVEAAAEICQSIFLDNGIFAAWSKGLQYDFAGYRDWVGFWIRHPAVDWCVIPDLIDGTAAENDELLRAWDLPKAVSVAVYHMHEPPERLARLVREYPRVGVGSSGGYRDPGTADWWNRIAEIMPYACDKDGYPICKLHGFRQLDPVIFSHIPYSSADSCTTAVSIGIDKRWVGPYMPASKEVRAIILMDRIESHASARRWCADSAGVQQNMELLG